MIYPKINTIAYNISNGKEMSTQYLFETYIPIKGVYLYFSKRYVYAESISITKLAPDLFSFREEATNFKENYIFPAEKIINETGEEIHPQYSLEQIIEKLIK